MAKIELNTEAGVKVAIFHRVELEGFPFGEFGGSSKIPLFKFELGDFNESATTLTYGTETADIVMTKAQYDDIKAEQERGNTSRVAGEPYTPPMPKLVMTDAILHGETPLNEIVADIIGHLNDLVDGYVYTSFTLKGTVLRGFSGVRSKNICKYDLADGFRFEQRPYSTDVEDSRHIVSLITAKLGTIVFLTANSGEVGRIEDALANSTDLVSAPHTVEVS